MFANNTENQLLQMMEGNEALLETYKQYQKEMSFFLSRMTHDIKNPLTLINSSLQLMESRQPALMNLPYWNSVKADVNDLFALLEQLHCFNYGDHLTPCATNVSDLLMELKISFEPFAKEKNALITITLADSCHPYIDAYPCDKVKLKEALVNLLKNGLEAVDSNGTLSIMCSVIDDKPKMPGKWLTLAMTNSGESIPEEDLEKIFTPFFTTKPEGSGLGLPTVHKIIAAHKGQLTVDSSKNQTTFTIYLPITEEC